MQPIVSAASEIDPKAYAHFIAAVRLLRVRLAGCEIVTNEANINPELVTIQIVQTVDRIGLEDTESNLFTFRQNNDLLFVANEEPHDEIAKIKTTFEFQYNLDPNFFRDSNLESFLDAFESHNLPLNSWPFFREFIHNMMGRMDFPIFTLPLLRPGETKKT